VFGDESKLVNLIPNHDAHLVQHWAAKVKNDHYREVANKAEYIHSVGFIPDIDTRQLKQHSQGSW
jgi:hypothetical protein